jgi:hypothetical protein
MWQPARLMQPRLRVLALYVSKSLTKWAAIQSIITPNSHRAAASFWGLKGRQEDQSGNIFRSPTMPRAEPNRHRSHATVSPAGTNLHIPLSGGIPYIIPTMPLGIPPQAATFEHHAPRQRLQGKLSNNAATNAGPVGCRRTSSIYTVTPFH